MLIMKMKNIKRVLVLTPQKLGSVRQIFTRNKNSSAHDSNEN